MYLFIFISTKICPHPKVKWYANAVFKVILFSFSLEILIDLKLILSCMCDTVSVTFHTGVTSVPCTCASSLYPTSAGPESSSHRSGRVVLGSTQPLSHLYPARSLPHMGLHGWFRGLLIPLLHLCLALHLSHMGQQGWFWDLLLLPFFLLLTFCLTETVV